MVLTDFAGCAIMICCSFQVERGPILEEGGVPMESGMMAEVANPSAALAGWDWARIEQILANLEATGPRIVARLPRYRARSRRRWRRL